MRQMRCRYPRRPRPKSSACRQPRRPTKPAASSPSISRRSKPTAKILRETACRRNARPSSRPTATARRRAGRTQLVTGRLHDVLRRRSFRGQAAARGRAGGRRSTFSTACRTAPAQLFANHNLRPVIGSTRPNSRNGTPSAGVGEMGRRLRVACRHRHEPRSASTIEEAAAIAPRLNSADSRPHAAR